jgi:hypothetical protein
MAGSGRLTGTFQAQWPFVADGISYTSAAQAAFADSSSSATASQRMILSGSHSAQPIARGLTSIDRRSPHNGQLRK